MILSKLPRFSGLLISVALLIQPALSRADLIYNSQPQPYGGEALGYGGAYTALSNESSGLFYNPAMKPQPDGLSLDLSLRSVGIVRRGQSELVRTLRAEPSFVALQGPFWGNYAGYLYNESSESSFSKSIPDEDHGNTKLKGIHSEVNQLNLTQASFLGMTFSYPINENLVSGFGLVYWDADVQQGSDAHYTYTNELSGNGQTFSYSGASTRTFLRTALGSGFQLRTGLKWVTGPLKVGASLSMPGSISYKAKTIYRYNAGLHFNGNKNTSPCNDNVTMAMICSDEFRSSSQTRISDYSENLPLSLSLGVAWESRFWSVSTDIEYRGSTNYKVSGLNLSESVASDGFLDVDLASSSYQANKKSVLRLGLGGKLKFAEDEIRRFFLFLGWYQDPSSRVFDKERLSQQLGAEKIDFSGTSFGVLHQSEGFIHFFGVVAVRGDGTRVIAKPGLGYETTSFSISRNNAVYSAGITF